MLDNHRLILVSISTLLLVACDSGTNGGSGANGGGDAGGSSTVGGSSAGGSNTSTITYPVCPSEKPEYGTPCGDHYVICSFGPGECCTPEKMVCMDGKWANVSVDCFISCPSSPPSQGDQCCSAMDSSDCSYGTCGGNAGTFIHAGCTPEQTWEVTEVPCQGPVDCGGTTCDAGSVCVETAGGAGVFRSCEADPCPPGALSCGCAASLCGGPPFECSTSPGLVSCVCSTCP